LPPADLKKKGEVTEMVRAETMESLTWMYRT